MSSEYSEMEMMTIASARRIKNDDIVFCGTGLPLLAAMTAKKTHAPKCTVLFETGSLDPTLLEIPLTVSDPRVVYGASSASGLADAFAFIQNERTGPHTLGVLSGAQIDMYGNLNSTSIGDYKRPQTRLPGSGGACDVACLVGRTMIFMRHEPRRFVGRVDYVTSPGWIKGYDSRTEAGLLRGGPEVVVTTLGVLRFHEKTKQMFLSEYYDFATTDQVQHNTGFEIDVSSARPEPHPSSHELEVLRRDVDPSRLILK